MLSLPAMLLTAMLAGGAEKALEIEANQRLCVAWSRAAIQMISEPNEPTPENYAGALETARAAVELVPNDKESLRIFLEIANTTSAALPRSQKTANELILRLSKLDPDDLVLRLARLTDAIDRCTTAEDRVTAYDRLLQHSSVEKISPIVASRLAYDYSLLLRRRGDEDAAFKQLRQAVKLDPAFPIATSQLAAYQLECNAPAGTLANSLVDAILANPSDIADLAELGSMCLTEGLYTEAEMLFSVVCQVANTNLVYEEYDGLLGQQMLALWSLGKHKQSAQVFIARNKQLIQIIEDKFKESPNASVGVDLPLSVNVIYAFVTKSGSLPSAAEVFNETILVFNREIKKMADEPRNKASLLFKKIWVTLCVGPDIEQVANWIMEADSLNPLPPEAKAKFNGWIALRTGKVAEAIALLKPLSANDSFARLGYGLACLKIGNTKEAAQEFCAIIKSNRGDIIGLYAADQLFEIIKTRLPPSANAPEIQSAVARLPKNFSEFGSKLNSFVQIEAEFLSRTAKPFDPLPCKIEITNLSPFPLSITPDGPIQSQAALLLETIVFGKQQGISHLPPVIFSIARRLQIGPKETMSFVIDVAYLPAVLPLMDFPLNGSNLQLELVTNFNLTLENFMAGFLGKITAKNSIRISPVQCTPEWREEALGTIQHCDKSDDLVTLVLFAFDLAQQSSISGAEAEVKEGWAQVTAAWKRLPPAAQAWTLMVMPHEPLDMTQEISKTAKESQDPRVQMSAILRWIQSENDPFLSTIERGTNEQLIAAAASVRSLIMSRLHDASQFDRSNEEAAVLGGTSNPVDLPMNSNPSSKK